MFLYQEGVVHFHDCCREGSSFWMRGFAAGQAEAGFPPWASQDGFGLEKGSVRGPSLGTDGLRKRWNGRGRSCFVINYI